MAQRFTFTAQTEHAGRRLDQVIAEALPALSRTRARRLLSQGAVFVDRHRVKVASRLVRAGQVIAVFEDARPTGQAVTGAGLQVRVVALLADVLVVDKPSGLPSAPTPQSDRNDALFSSRQQLRDLGEPDELFVVHRLDQPTSGLLAFARSRQAAAELSRSFADHGIGRSYLALIPTPSAHEVHVTAAIDGKTASTYFTVVESRGPISLVEARLETGRMHQVRIHADVWGSPILGDSKHGRSRLHAWWREQGAGHPRPPRLALHAHRLDIPSRDGSDAMRFEAPLSSDLAQFWDALDTGVPSLGPQFLPQ